MSKTQKHALTVLASPELKFDKPGINELALAIGREFQAIRQLQREDAARFAILGVMLHRLKYSMPPRGGFETLSCKIICDATGWTESTAAKNRSLAMRLAMTFIEKARLSKQDLLALPGGQMTLDVGDAHPARKFLEKLSKFVGDYTRTELLIKYGLTGVGLRSELTDGEGDDDQELTPEAKAQLAREQAWLELWNQAQAQHEVLADPNRLQLLTDLQKVEALKATFVENTKLLNEHIAALRAVTVS